jgi:ribose transport system ATP-binding protein
MENDMHAGRSSLRLQHIWKRFGPTVAVKDVSLEARGGEIHALLGENGAGKSTLMGIASGSIRPDEGTVEICGRTMDTADAAQAQQLGLAIVHQHPAVMPDMTVSAASYTHSTPPMIPHG